jgi:hypothetical protein
MRTFLQLSVMSVLLGSLCQSLEQTQSEREKADSLTQAYLQAFSLLTTPELEEKKQQLLSHQRRGYASTLTEIICGDGLAALVSYLRMRLQIEYSISHELVLVDLSSRHEQPTQTDSISLHLRSKPTIILPTRPRQRMMIGLDIDWSFPEDPWKRE